MEVLVLDNLKSAIKEEKLLTQVPEQQKQGANI
jgi:glyoxylate reductase